MKRSVINKGFLLLICFALHACASTPPRSVTFNAGVDTEKTVRPILDTTGNEPILEMALTGNVPPCKILFYKRGDNIRPILFYYDEGRKEYVFYGMWLLTTDEFYPVKDTPKFRKKCEERYSSELAKSLAKYLLKGAYDSARDMIRVIEEVKPIGANAYNGMAWFLATCPIDRFKNAEKALDYAIKSINLDKSSENLDTLAAVYAELKEFDKAIEYQEQALRLCPQEERKAYLKERLRSYKAHKSYLEWTTENEQTLIDKYSGQQVVVWKGVVNQPPDYSYPVRVRVANLSKGTDAGCIIYPTLGCGETLRCVEAIDNTYKFRCSILYGGCIPGGTVEIVDNKDGTANLQWYYPDGRRGAQGSLRRENY